VDTIDFPRRRSARGRLLLLFVLLGVLLFGAETLLSYYVDALWFGALGYADVFWKTLNFQGALFTAAGGVIPVWFGDHQAVVADRWCC